MKIGINLINHSIQNTIAHYIALVYCLRSLLESDITNFDWEMVMVENGSTSEYTRKFATFLEALPNIEVIWLPENVGIPKARNISTRKLLERNCDYIVEIHTDHIFPSMWAAPLIEYMEENPTVGSCGPGNILTATWPGLPHLGDPYEAEYTLIYTTHPEVVKSELVSVKEYRETKKIIEQLAEASRQDILMEGLLHPAVKRATMYAGIGLYEEEMPVNQTFEDLDEYYRAELAGWKFCINWNSVVYHYGAFQRALTAAMVENLPDWSHRVRYNEEFCINKHGRDEWFKWMEINDKRQEAVHNLGKDS